MGKVRTKTVKKSAKVMVEKFYSRLTTDFQVNKRITQEFALMPSKRMRNKVAGYITTLMKRIGRGPVRGISLKLQEEERERRLDYVPDVSALDAQSKIPVDLETESLLASMGMSDLKRVVPEATMRGPAPGPERSARPPRGPR